MTDPYGRPYPQYGQYPGQTPQYPGYPTPPKNNGMAVASMILSLLGLPACGCGLLLALTGAILGHVALGHIKRDPHTKGTGMAMTGIIAGWIVVALWVGVITFAILAGTGALGPEWQSEFN